MPPRNVLQAKNVVLSTKWKPEQQIKPYCKTCNITDMWRHTKPSIEVEKKEKSATVFDSWKYKHKFNFQWSQEIMVCCMSCNYVQKSCLNVVKVKFLGEKENLGATLGAHIETLTFHSSVMSHFTSRTWRMSPYSQSTKTTQTSDNRSVRAWTPAKEKREEGLGGWRGAISCRVTTAANNSGPLLWYFHKGWIN